MRAQTNYFPARLQRYLLRGFFYGLKTGEADDVSQEIEKGLKEMEDVLSKKVPEFIDMRTIKAEKVWFEKHCLKKTVMLCRN